MSERRKLSIAAPSEDRPANRTRGWNVSPNRAAALKDRARAQRRDPTPAQAALWDQLKDKQLGFAFNREVVMGSTIADFACKPRWLVIEIGGTEGPEATIAELSDRKLTEVGVRVLRFADEQVLADIEPVLAAIREELAKPFERPLIRN
ncbi:MAG: DUF559 domain-containing protein [Novosphingobium sp.]|nr:DUF559 domain-containing protein [Novosphingobium sp.]MBO9602350.1 DUF559 domain-containing protein [Novosphingobium sp.]